MKPDTRVWLLCESVGKPANTLKVQCTVREATLTIAQWLMGVYMGQKIRVILARDEADLIESKRSATNDIMQDLEAVLAGGTPEQKELVCPHGEPINDCQDCRVEHNRETM